MTISATSQGLRMGVATSSSRPAVPFDGQVISETDTDSLKVYNGTAWVGVSKVAQLLSSFKSDTFSMSGTTFTDVTGLTVSITPSSTTSKIYIVASVNASQSVGTNNGFLRLARGGTAIGVGDTAGGRTRSGVGINAALDQWAVASPLTFLDSPATTSATTYSVQLSANGSSTVYVNRSSAYTDYFGYPSLSSTITVMEILA
jgi:hypothetical protein